MTGNELAELSGDIINWERLQKNSSDSSRYHTNWLKIINGSSDNSRNKINAQDYLEEAVSIYENYADSTAFLQ